VVHYGSVGRFGQWTVPYDNQVFVKGDKLVAAAAQANTVQTDAGRLFDAGGDIESVWSDRDEMLGRWQHFVELYTLIVSLLALAVLSMLQTAGLAFRPP